MAVYNLEEVKSIPIMQVLGDYGIEVNRGGYCRLRPERSPSCKIYDKQNTFYDFGASAGGDVINLVETVEGLNTGNAIQTLGSRYGLQDQVEANRKGYKTLTDNQYLRLGVDQYELGVDMNKLFAEDPVSYANILRSYAILSVEQTRDLYFETINDYLQRRYDYGEASLEAMCSRLNIDTSRADFEKEYSLLYSSVKGCSNSAWINIGYLKPDPEKDLRNMERNFKPVIRDYAAEPKHFGIIRPSESFTGHQVLYDVDRIVSEGEIPPGTGADAVDKKLLKPEDIILIIPPEGKTSAHYYDGEGFVTLQNYNPTESYKRSDVLQQVSDVQGAQEAAAMQSAASFEMC